MSKKIIITGAAGFIGSAITTELNKKGFKIGVIDNLSFGTREWISPYVQDFFEEDIRDFEKIDVILKEWKPDIIIHLAAIHFIPYCNANPYEANSVNITGTFNLTESAKRLPGLEHFLFASTAAVYPIYDSALHEKIHPQPMDIYGSSKLAGEKIVEAFSLFSGIKTTTARFFNAFGPNETNPHLIPEIERQLKTGSRTLMLGNLEPKRDFIHTEDMAKAVIAMLNRKGESTYDVFNLGRGIEYSVKEIVEAFANEIGEEIKINVDPSRVRRVERMHLLADVEKLKTDTGWEPKWTLEEGIRSLMKS